MNIALNDLGIDKVKEVINEMYSSGKNTRNDWRKTYTHIS